jgi:hypothetical protein
LIAVYFCVQRLAYQPGLRPLLEKNSPVPERKGEEINGKAPRNCSDPGFKTPGKALTQGYWDILLVMALRFN